MTKADLRTLLDEARDRTLALVAAVSESDMNRVHDPLMSPLVWDLGHIAAFEDLWLCQRAGRLDALRPELAELYDAAETPRAERAEISYLPLPEAREFMDAVRERALDVLDEADVSSAADEELSRGGLVWDMLVQHEHQHNETMLQTLTLAEPGVYEPARRPHPPVAARSEPDMVRVEGGPFAMGLAAERFAYDNERPQHRVDLPAFEIDAGLVTNGDFRDFMERGGYARRSWWSEAGWEWRRTAGVDRPLHWTEDGRQRWFERLEPIQSDLPVMYVSWYEADAYARALGKRLPTEQEWEKAASWDEAAAAKRRYPWGDAPPDESHANLDQLGFGPAPVGAYPDGAAACGALGMLGDAWEWTATEFAGYPGFRAFPYPQYSEVFFGDGYRVLRGGSWATRRRVAGNTVRNWDLPERRQIHCGFRCAVDA